MKSIIITTALSLFMLNAFAGIKDTLEIQFSQGGKIVILTEGRTELKEISTYNVNKILEDVVDTLENSDESISYLVITDNLGEEYIKKQKTFNFDINFNKEEEDDYSDISNYRGQDLDERRKSRRRYRRTTYGTFNVDVGKNNYLNNGSFPSGNTPWSVKNWGSWYVGLNGIWNTKITGVFNIEYGAGFSWYNFKLDNEEFIITRGPDQVEYTAADLTDFPDPIRSKLTASYFNLYFVPTLDFGRGGRSKRWFSFNRSKGFRIGAGVYGGYRMGSHSKFVWDDGGKNKNRDRGNFFVQNWRYGIRGQVGFRDLELFVMYDLNELFEDNRHPAGQLNAISFGIVI
jgi:hypothetical protein